MAEKGLRPKSKNLRSLRFAVSFLRPYKAQLTGAAFFLLFTAGITLSIGQGVRLLIDRGMISGSGGELAKSVILFLVLGFLVSIGTYFRHYFVSYIGERVTTDLRIAVYEKILYLHPAYFEVNSAAEIQSRLTTDVTLLQTLMGSSFSMALRNILSFFGGVIFLFITNVKLTLVVLVSVPLIMGPILLYGRALRRLSRETQDQLAAIGVYVQESLFNIKTLQAFNHEEIDQVKFRQISEKYLKISRIRIRQRSLLFGLSIFFILAAIAGMLYIGGRDVLNGVLTPGDLGAVIFYAFMIASSVGALSETMGDLQSAAGATERLMELYRADSKIASAVKQETVTAPQMRGDIALLNVTFAYETRPETQVIRGLSHHLPGGKTYALVGPSGAGKSTLFDLLMRFYDPVAGAISVEGVDIRQWDLETYRNAISMVPQTPSMFSGTVADNIRYAKEGASGAEVAQAAKAAYADEFIEKLPLGYDTPLGEYGRQLSGGQKQRIAIARAILKNPRILLLDEATNSLDAESEYKVQQAIENLRANRTTLIIAHRLSTVMNADEIIVMEDGKISDVGKHAELLTRSPLYKRFCDLQFVTV